eukprot:gnl/Spiro4/9969_TR5296_c0_g1_i1.p1 gnl/Spiro4/9969_TR5296_c0_g1~~gnl/Spiro4/9969_TR5296_c0_g1_i1.p1  ORF type:complete len:256 (-),score=43.48 gnl/Spiro4/9969_TR5296_c0_g1_i1:109-771(-)
MVVEEHISHRLHLRRPHTRTAAQRSGLDNSEPVSYRLKKDISRSRRRQEEKKQQEHERCMAIMHKKIDEYGKKKHFHLGGGGGAPSDRPYSAHSRTSRPQSAASSRPQSARQCAFERSDGQHLQQVAFPAASASPTDYPRVRNAGSTFKLRGGGPDGCRPFNEPHPAISQMIYSADSPNTQPFASINRLTAAGRYARPSPWPPATGPYRAELNDPQQFSW